MRHVVNLLLGPDLGAGAAEAYSHVLRQGSEQRRYVQVLAVRPAEGGMSVDAMEAAADGTFCSVLDDEFACRPAAPLTLATDDDLRRWAFDLYRRTITVDLPGDDASLLVNVFVPLGAPDLVDYTARLATTLAALPSQFTVDVIGLAPDVVGPAAQSTTVVQAIGQLTPLCHRFLLMENRNVQGVSLNLDAQQLAHIIAEYACLTCETYVALFSPNDEPQPVTTFGLSVLHFDRYYFLASMLRRAYIHILEREHVEQADVLLSTVQPVATARLSGHTRVFTSFFEREVKPRVKQRVPSDEILRDVAPLLKKEIEELADYFTDYFSSDKLSLPEKEAVLSCLLGLDDDRIHDYALQEKCLLLDDCVSDALQVFIDENNHYVHHQLDREGNDMHDADGSPLWVSGPIQVCARVDDGQVYNPLDEIKQLRSAMRDAQTYIRTKEDEMKRITQAQTETRESQKRLVDGGFTFDGTTFRLLHDVEERPLADTYEPTPTEVRAVDLRRGFLPIEQQGALGACSAFALTSIFEYMLKACGTTLDLSALFVYHNVCEKDDEGHAKDDGSSFFDVIQSLETDGVCAETLCPYDIDAFPTLTLTDEARADARQHLVLKAKNVPLTHEALTSALSEGYPVAVCLRLFDGFTDNDNGFVYRPTDEQLKADDKGRHAVVLCGYSEEDKIYIVRNSWGEHFGDKGYCYIPFSYIEDKELASNAVIITEVSAGAKFRPELSRRVDFDAMDDTIRYSVLRILVDEQKHLLALEEQQYQRLRHEYMLLMGVLGTPQLRRQLREKAADRIEGQKRDFERRIDYEKEQRPKQLAQMKRDAWKWKLSWGVTLVLGTALLLIIIYSYDWKELTHSWETYVTAGLVVGLVAIVWLGISWWRSRVRRLDLGIRSRIDTYTDAAHRLGQQLDALTLRMQVAGMVLDEYNTLNQRLHSQHKVMRSYVANLAQWLTEEKRALHDSHIASRMPFVEIFTDDDLERYARERIPAMTADIHLYTFLADYHLTEAAITDFKRTAIKGVLLDVLRGEADRFSMVERLMRPDADCPLSSLAARSQCFAQARRLRPSSPTSMSLLIATATDDELRNFQAFYPRQFTSAPTLHTIASKDKAVVLQTEGHTPDELALNKE